MAFAQELFNQIDFPCKSTPCDNNRPGRAFLLPLVKIAAQNWIDDIFKSDRKTWKANERVSLITVREKVLHIKRVLTCFFKGLGKDEVSEDESCFVNRAAHLIIHKNFTYESLSNFLLENIKLGRQISSKNNHCHLFDATLRENESFGNVSTFFDRDNMHCSRGGACRQAVALLAVANVVKFLDKNVGGFILTSAPKYQKDMFMFYEYQMGRGFVRQEGLRNFFEKGSLDLHQKGAELASIIFDSQIPDINISLFDLPLLLGKWPPFRATNIRRTLRECLPYFLFSKMSDGEAWASEGCILYGRCMVSLSKWLRKSQNIIDLWKNEPYCCTIKKIVNKFVERKRAAVMEVMLYSKHMHRPQKVNFYDTFIRNDNLTRLFGTKLNDMAYPLIPLCTSFSHTSEFAEQKLYLLPCIQFKPIPTDFGLCQGFNTRLSMKSSSFQTTLDEISIEGDKDLVMASEEKSFTFMLDRHALARKLWAPLDDKLTWRGGFDLTLSHHSAATAYRRHRKPVKLGFHTTMTIEPKQIVTEKQLLSMPPEKKGCIMTKEAKENSFELFEDYSWSQCHLECMVKIARKTCDCTPWEYPSETDDDPLCDLFGNYCFDIIMGNASLLSAECQHCIPNCDNIHYEVEETAKPIDAAGECSQFFSWHFKYVHTRIILGRLEGASKFIVRGSNGKPLGMAKHFQDTIDICKAIFNQDIALVTVKMKGRGYQRYLRTYSMTFVEKISFLGKFPFLGSIFYLRMNAFQVALWVSSLA